MLSTGGTLLDGFAIFALGVAMPLIIAEFHIRPGVVGLIGAALVLGAVFGAGIGGPVADRLGRKRLMLADMIIIGAGAGTSALANGGKVLWPRLVARIESQDSMGFETATVFPTNQVRDLLAHQRRRRLGRPDRGLVGFRPGGATLDLGLPAALA